MNKRYIKRTSRRLYIREQLTGYGSKNTIEIPYQEKYINFMLNERGCEIVTVEKNLRFVREFVEYLRQEYDLINFVPEKIEPGHIRRYLAYLKNERNNKPSTRNSKLSALASYYFFLECYEYVEEDDNPTLFIRKAKVPRQLPVYITKEEAEQLIEAASRSSCPERDVAILRVMIQTGIRVGELVKLRLRDIDFKERTLSIQGKGHRERLVPITDNTCDALKAYLDIRYQTQTHSDAVFLNQHQNPIKQGPLYTLFKKLCLTAGVIKPKLSVCHLRHTCLTLLLQEGADLMALKKLAGHQSLRTTQLYIHVTQVQLRQAMKKHPLS